MKELIHIRKTGELSLPAEEKEGVLFSRLVQIPSLIVALSGGADSAYLAWAAHRTLSQRALSVTALSPSFPAYDRTGVEGFVRKLGLPHEFIETHEMENPAYRANAPDRCYFCKDELFSVLDEMARTRGFAAVAYGVNADDTLDFRPGHRAATEHKVLTPLLDASLHKADIRLLSLRAGLPTWIAPLPLASPHGCPTGPKSPRSGSLSLSAVKQRCARWDFVNSAYASMTILLASKYHTKKCLARSPRRWPLPSPYG